MKRFFSGLRRTVDVALRSQQIGWVLSAHGLGGTLTALGFALGKNGLSWVGVTQPVRLDSAFGKNLARTFARLGPTFIKLGQILATRPDIVGEPVAEQLRILFDRVPPVSYRKIRKILHQEFGAAVVRQKLKSIAPEPLGSASISQVHEAKLTNGTPVILKVQKPGVEHLVRTDLRILENWIIPMNRVYPKWQLRAMFDDFKEATLREIDYRLEAQNIDRFQSNYRSYFTGADVVFPSYHSDLTTKRVIVLEPMRGKKISDLAQGSDVAKRAAAKGLEAILEQIFSHGFFHADPHGGNLFFLEEGGQLGFIDLGLVGQLDPTDKQKFLKVILAVLKRDRSRLAKSLFELGESAPQTDYPAFESQIDKMLDGLKAKGVNNIRLEEMVGELLQIARQNHIHIPNRYVLMMRACLVIEGVARELDPDLSLFSVATPVVARSLLGTYNPLRFFRR